jgi:hypothetical protein
VSLSGCICDAHLFQQTYRAGQSWELQEGSKFSDPAAGKAGAREREWAGTGSRDGNAFGQIDTQSHSLVLARFGHKL